MQKVVNMYLVAVTKTIVLPTIKVIASETTYTIPKLTTSAKKEINWSYISRTFHLVKVYNLDVFITSEILLLS